jgi:hypothetical protein
VIFSSRRQPTEHPRLLLVEFMTVDRFHRGIPLPFVKGWAREAGLKTIWLRFGLRASARFERGGTGINLPKTDSKTLERTLRRDGFTHVLFDRRPAPDLVGLVRRLRPRPCPAFLSEEEVPSGPAPADKGLTALTCSVDVLTAWLGLPARRSGPDNLFETLAPDFGWTAANGLARAAQPLPFLVAGRECSYSLPLRSNPCFRGLSWRGASIRSGCAFCRRPRQEERWDTPPLNLARRQLRAIHQTHPPFPGRLAVRVCGEALFVAADRFARMLKSMGMPAADFLFDARADRLVRHEGRLRAALHALRGTGHRIHICLVGIENFSAAELARLNKGVSPATNLAAVDLLLRLEREEPDTFRFREHGGLSLITFNPWTTLKDVRLNAAVLRELRLERPCGKFLTARLRLYPELPLARLARREKLILRRYRDPLLNTARRNFYPEEMPWRFRHRELEPLNAVFTRLQKDPALEGDPLYARVQTWLARLPRQGEGLADVPLALASAAGPGIRSPAQLLARARATIARPDTGRMPPGNTEVAAELAGRKQSWVQWETAAGVKPVRRIECMDAAHAALCLAHPETFPNARTCKCPDWSPVPGGQDVFFGADPALVEKACALTRRCQRRKDPGPPAEARRLMTRIAPLLGYPGCCGRAFARDVTKARGSNEWLWVARRAAHPGPVPAGIHPGLLQYVPCSLDCAPSLRLTRRTLEAVRTYSGEARAQGLLRELDYPALMLLDGADAGATLHLEPLSTPAERFRYRACGSGSAPGLQPVREGDELIVEPGCITVLRRGREHAVYPLNAFLWWTRGAFHLDFWRNMAALRSLPRPDLANPGEAPRRAEPPSPASLRLRRDLLPQLSQKGPVFAGYRAERLSTDTQPRIALTLRKGRDRFVLFIERRDAVRHACSCAGDYAVYYNDTSLTAPKRDAVEAVLHHLGTEGLSKTAQGPPDATRSAPSTVGRDAALPSRTGGHTGPARPDTGCRKDSGDRRCA